MIENMLVALLRLFVAYARWQMGEHSDKRRRAALIVEIEAAEQAANTRGGACR